ncbi:MAG: MBL fold metallo-hydrolase [Verrucomicrobia bacterium]|nr:MBL fold metallo-hydrolase [Verrucomicrobiota bacterium]
MKITLHGAAGEVTGSAYLVETDRARVLVDFGMFQGGARTEAKNVLPSGLDVPRLDAVLVTHAHLDHTGRLPLLTKAGYAGPVLATKATIELAGLILRDSAKVQLYDVERTNRRRERSGKPPVEALYTAADVERMMERFHTVEFHTPVAVAKGISARYVEAGHMLGSASIELTVEEEHRRKIVVFSGDLGPTGLAIVREAETFKRADAVFLESTYGDRNHKPMKETLAEFRALIEQAVRQKARILVPAFAVGRTQQILFHLDELFCGGTVAPFPVYLDSPMAIEATQIYQHHPDLFDTEVRDMQRACDIARRHAHVKPTPTPQDSMALNSAPGPCCIMAGSGMCSAGRILHHLRHGLWRPETVVMIVGFQGEGTLGRQLVDGAAEVKIFGETISVRAQIHTLNGFSAHAGQGELLKWFQSLAPSKPQVVLTHGEARGREPLAELLRKRHGVRPLLPGQGDVVRL